MRFPRKPPPLVIIVATLLGLGCYHAVQAQVEAWSSSTPASNNQTPPFGAPENHTASATNDIQRYVMSQIRAIAEQSIIGWFGPDGGTSVAYYITPRVPPASFISGQRFTFIPNNSNTITNPTLKIGSLGPVTIAKISNVALLNSDLSKNVPAEIVYNSALGGFVLLNPVSTQISANNIAGTLATAGKRTIWLPAGALVPRTTSGASISTAELSSNKMMLKALAFSGASQNFAQFQIGMPKSWDQGTVSGQVNWTALAGSGTVQWYLQCVAISDDDALDTAFGSAQGITDTFITSNDLHISSETSAITAAGSPQQSDMLACQVYRDAPVDTHAADAYLLGLKLFYTTNRANDD